MRFLITWQSLAAQERRHGEPALSEIMRQLEGYVAPNPFVGKFHPAGASCPGLRRVCWIVRVCPGACGGSGPGERTTSQAIRNSTPITFTPRSSAAVWQHQKLNFDGAGAGTEEGVDKGLADCARSVHHILQQNGALYFDEFSALGDMADEDVVSGFKRARGKRGCWV